MISLLLAQKNIFRKQERSILTIIGVLLAVGSFVALLSIAEGLNLRLEKEVYSKNVDIYILPNSAQTFSKGPIGNIIGTGEAFAVTQSIPETPLLKAVSQSTFKQLPKKKQSMIDFLNEKDGKYSELLNIKKAIGISRLQQNIGEKTVVFLGIPFEPPGEDGTNYFKAFFPGAVPIGGILPVRADATEDPYGLSLKRTPQDLTPKDKVFVSGSKIAQEMNFKPESSLILQGINDKISVNLQSIAAFNAGYQDYLCYIPIQTAMTLDDSHGKVKEIWIQVSEPSKIAQTQKILRNNFPDLVIKTKYEYQGLSQDLVKYAWLLQFAIALIGILIATTASMNTMLMSAFERVKEFGALRAIGANRVTILMMILFESLILSLTGGVVGIFAGILGSKFLDGGVKILFQTVFPMASITFNLIIYALCLSIFIGLIGAVIPAVIIYRMDIIKSLKWD